MSTQSASLRAVDGRMQPKSLQIAALQTSTATPMSRRDLPDGADLAPPKWSRNRLPEADPECPVSPGYSGPRIFVETGHGR